MTFWAEPRAGRGGDRVQNDVDAICKMQVAGQRWHNKDYVLVILLQNRAFACFTMKDFSCPDI
jgi:hypothetical protein